MSAATSIRGAGQSGSIVGEITKASRTLMDRSNDRVHPDGEPLPIAARATLVAWTALMTVLCFTLFTWIVHDRRMPRLA